ncbi:hypothetical protein MHU86_24414 [Fragilaria crotonensis]|nr:hypothetical protein MHU86_24414 [Fragilaria crotonensis]
MSANRHLTAAPLVMRSLNTTSYGTPEEQALGSFTLRKLMRLTNWDQWQEGFIGLKVDATNAYANSPPPDQPTFVYIDDQYADWYMARHGVAVSRDMVLPVQHALQGHPESGALWERFVNRVIARHGFKSTTHERSLYQGVYKGHCMLICRQVDDMAIGCVDPEVIRDLVRTICLEDGIDLRDESVLDSFKNGVDVEQTD